MRIIFASNNAHKLKEIRAIMPTDLEVIGLQDSGIFQEIPEPHETLEKNAQEKSRTIFKLTGESCFSEDTGLEVEALAGAPGVRSARYAGENADSTKNIEKLLKQLQQKENRKARFRTVISLIWDGKEFSFEGICTGTISHHSSGEQGFGYDPVFIPDGSSKSFAEMDISEKNIFSHRKKATEKLINFLHQQCQE
jgi:XTP/dITP diphosphohydrolase